MNSRNRQGADLPNDFYRTLTVRLVRIARELGVPRDECEDVAQDTLLEAVKHPELFRDEHAVQKLWAGLTGQIIHNKAVDAFRRLGRRATQSLDTLPVESSGLEEVKHAEYEEKECLESLLERLRLQDPENYWLLSEHHLQERPIQELADEAGITPNEIRCRLYRTKKKLRRWTPMSGLRGEDTLSFAPMVARKK